MLLKEEREPYRRLAQRRWLHVQKEINVLSCHFEDYHCLCRFNDGVPSRSQLGNRAPWFQGHCMGRFWSRDLLSPGIVRLPVAEFEAEGAPNFLGHSLFHLGCPNLWQLPGELLGFPFCGIISLCSFRVERSCAWLFSLCFSFSKALSSSSWITVVKYQRCYF